MQNACMICGNPALEIVYNGFKCPACGNTFSDKNGAKIDAELERANLYLKDCDFSKASNAFEKIIEDNKECHDAIYGKLLADNGVLFTADPKNNGKNIPTINMINNESIFSSKYLKMLKEVCPSHCLSERIYILEYVEKLRIESLALAKKQDDFDIFICFKNIDNSNGDETSDTKECLKMYYRLKEKGYRVFYSPETLKNYTGHEFEPIIYNAISTSKVMLVYGENADYFSTPWMKNEWFRFLKMSKHANDKNLIPIINGVSEYDLPVDLRGIQSLDASKNTYYDELFNTVKKIFKVNKKMKNEEEFKTDDANNDEVETSKSNRYTSEPIKSDGKSKEWRGMKSSSKRGLIYAFIVALVIAILLVIILNNDKTEEASDITKDMFSVNTNVVIDNFQNNYTIM